MSSRTLPTTSRQQPPAAVAAMSRRRFWANLVVQVSGLLAMLVVAASPALVQAQPGVSIDRVALELTEGSGSKDYGVWLNSAPTGMVSVTVAVSDEDAGLELDKTVLMFGQIGWNIAQRVTVTAMRDGLYIEERRVTLNHIVQGANYDDVLADNVVVTILNNDDTEPKPTEIRLSLDREPVIEGEVAILFEVTATLVGGIALNQATEVTVTIEEDLLAARSLLSMLGVSDDSEAAEFGGDFTRVPKTDSTITIPAGKVGGSVVVSNLLVVEDIVPEGSELLVVTGTAAGFTVSPTTLQIDDNDPTSVRINSEDMVGEVIREDVLEGGIFTYTVGLRYYPHTNATVTVMVEVTGGEDFVENLSELETTLLTFHNDDDTFSRIRSPTPQIVEVKTKDNSDYGDSPKEVTLAHRVVRTDDHAYRGLQADTVVLTITDNDRAGIRISPARFFDVSEGDSAGITYYVELLSRPPAGVRVDVSISISEGDANLIGELDPLSLNFTADNWDTPLPVTVIPRDDDDSAPDQRVTITHTVSSNDPEYQAQAREQPQAEIEVGLLIREDDGIPTEIILTLNPSSGSEGSVSLELEITASWKDDAVPGTDTEVYLRFNHEDDINSLGLGADEVAGGNEYSLSRALIEQWNLLIIDAGASEGVEGPFQLEINDDDIDENDEYIVFGGTTDIDGVTVSPTLFLILDDDDSGVRFTLFGSTAGEEAGANLGEGAEFQYFVELESEPTDRVTVMVSVVGGEGYDEEITIRANAEEDRPLDSGEDLTKGGVLIFTSENWNQTQTVTAVVENNDYYRGYLEVILTHTAEGGDGAYDDLPATVIKLGITENDDPPTGIELSLQPTEVGEDSGTVEVTVVAYLVGGALGAAMSVPLRINDPEDTAGFQGIFAVDEADYMFTGSEAIIIIERSEQEGRVVFPLTVLQDRIDEDDETLVFGVGTITTDPELDIPLDIMVADLKITDDDEPGLVFLPPTGSLSVPEGDTSVVGKTYSVALTSQPAGPVTVNLSVVAGREAIEEIPEGLTFSEDDWNVPQDVLITPTPNIHTNDDVLVQIQHVAIGGGYTAVSEDYILTIKDDDDAPTQVMVEVIRGIEVTEDGGPQEVILWIALDGSPYGVATTVDLFIGDGTAEAGTDFSITSGMISGGGNSQLVGDRVTLDIPAEEQVIVVTLELAPLPDDIDEGNETIVFVGEVDSLIGGQATIEILDDEDDVAGIVLSTSSLQVAEGGDAVTYTVRLASQPLGDVDVYISFERGPGLEIISRMPSSLTFTQEDWNEPKTVEVSAVMDDTRNDIRQLTITLFAESTENNNDGYFDRPSRELSLELIDPSVLISKPSATVAEGGIAEYGVRLTSEPTSPVKVKVSIRDEHRDEIDFLQLVVDGEGQGQPSRGLTLTFDSDDWKAYQTVTIQTTNNRYSGTNPPVVIKHTVSSAGDYADVTAEDFTLTITDDEAGDAATSVLLSLNPTAVDESDGDGVATVTLTARLDGPARNEDTVVSLIINDPEEGLPTGISMEDIAEIGVDFTLSDLKSPRFELTIPARMKDTETVLVLNPVNDNVDEGDSETIVISGDAGLLEVQSAILNINDDDDRGVMVSPIRLTVAEGADPVTYTVELTSEPAGNDPVMVELSVAYTGVAEGITQDEVLFNGESGPLTLLFGGDSGNPWNEGQDVGVTLTANETIDGARNATLLRSVSGADYTGEPVEEVPMTLTDYGVVLVSDVPFSVKEGGRSTYTLRLTSAPMGDVTVGIIIPTDYGDVLRVDQEETRVLNGDNWSQGVDVTVTLEEDDFFNEKRVLTIEHRVTASEDPNYEELEVAGVEVTLIDDEEQPRLLLELSRESFKEGSGDDNTIVAVTAIVSLDGDLRSEVTMGTLSFGGALDDTAKVREDYKGQGGILFTILAGEESVEVSFELELIGDQVDEGDESLTITAFDNLLGSASARFTIEDDDEAGVGVTLMDQSVREGDEIGYTVVLESQPIEDVRVDVAVERVSEDSEARPSDVTVAVEGPLTLTFSSSDWFRPRDILLTVKPDLDAFGELEIRHTLISAGDPTYAALPPVSAVLELTDVDVDLGALEVMTAAGETTDLLNADGVEIAFSADVGEYFATVPFPDRMASITATPSVIEDRPDEQEKGRVRIFRKNNDGTLEALEGGADVASTATEVNLPEGDTFAFLIEVSARPLPLADDEEIARQTYTLTLRRALPASAELQVYLDSDTNRETLITTLDFGPDEDEMSLILILRDDGNIRYSISGINISGLVDGFAVPVVGAEDPADFETPVTLSRADDVDEDVPYSLSFTATPERPLADANPLSATIEGTLKASTDTRTEIQATYLGEHQDEKEPISPDAEIRVSDNGTVTIELRVVRSGGGDRPFNQSDFSIATDPVDVATAVLMEGCDCYTLEIAPRDEPFALTVEAVGSLGDKIGDPLALAFTVSFESPQAVIRPVANPDPLLAFRRPFFAFVGEDNELPLEVVLVGDIPLADSDSERDRILGGLALAVNLDGEGALNTVTIAAEGGRDLTFGISESKNSVTVAVASGRENPLVNVEPLVFTAHFLSLEHDEEIDFRQDPDLDFRISELSLRGEDESDDSWSFEVVNEAELADDQYEVIEVIRSKSEKMISVVITKAVSTTTGVETTYTVGTQTVQIVDGDETVELGEATDLDEAEALSTYGKYLEFAEFAADPNQTTFTILIVTIEEITYSPSDSEMNVPARLLLVTRLHPNAEDSRIVLKFEYFLDGRSAGVFTRAIDLINGVASNLKVEVTPSVLVVAKGGAPGQVQLVISNLDLEDDPSAPEASIVFRVDPDLVVEPQGEGTIDRINSRFEQTLNVTAVADADRENYTVVVEVLLPGKRLVTADFTVDINDAPQYEGEKKLTVYESGDNREAEYRLQIVDSDGGLQFLEADDLSLQVIGFGDPFKVMDVGDVGDGYDNGYFKLAFSEISRVGQEEEGSANGKPNSLTWTLTLTGRLATPFNSVVQLRLFGVTDGFDGFEQYLTVQVKNRPPQLELARTQGIAVFLKQEPVSIAVVDISDDVTDIVVLEAPDDLVVKYDETERAITLRRLNIDPASDAVAGDSGQVKLAALDAEGGRKVVTITVARPPLLPQIAPQEPLLIPVGEMRTRPLSLEKPTILDVTWRVAVDDPDAASFFIIGGPEIIVDEDGNVEVSLTISGSAPFNREFNLQLTAEGGGYEWDALLPVALVAAEPKPRLKLSATVSDKMGSVSSFAFTESLLIGVALEGKVSSSEDLAGATTTSFEIRIVRLNPDGSGESEGEPLILTAEATVTPNDDGLDIDQVPVSVEEIRNLGIDVAGQVVEVSIEHRLDGEVSDTIIVGDSLRLRVSEGPGRVDADNDGLPDGDEGDDGPHVLGPITVAVSEVTGGDSGIAASEVSLSLGDAARFLGLGECGRVTLTLSEDEDEDGILTLYGCSSIDSGSQLLSTETVAVLKLVEEMNLELDEGESYQLIDLSATFDSSEANADEPLVISLPFDPRTHGIYRFDRETGEWMQVIAADGPGQPGLDGPGVESAEGNAQSSFYAPDFDRDGSVDLRLLVVPMDLDFALKDASLEGRQLEISGEESRIIDLVGLVEGLTVEITGAALDGGNVTGTVSVENSTVELIGQKRTRNGPEELLVEAFDGDGNAVASITLYVRVPNQMPKITFEHEEGKEFRLQLPSGEFTTTFTLDPTEGEGVLALAANTETVLLVMISDADGDLSFDLELMDNGRGVAKLESNFRGIGSEGEPLIFHELTLSSMGIGAGRFEVSVLVTDLSDVGDDSKSVATLFGCVFNSEDQCPAAPRSRGGGGGGTGLLWLLFAAPAALCRATRLRQRLAARARRATP